VETLIETYEGLFIEKDTPKGKASLLPRLLGFGIIVLQWCPSLHEEIISSCSWVSLLPSLHLAVMLP
jgi:hypothetical protein